MTMDPYPGPEGPDYFELQRAYRARGFEGDSFDMSVMRYGQSWRLLEGPEPSRWHSFGPPSAHMRYGPYTFPDYS